MNVDPVSFKTKILLKFVPPTGPPSACVAREAWCREGLPVPPKSVTHGSTFSSIYKMCALGVELSPCCTGS
jgi:hypothetical protein